MSARPQSVALASEGKGACPERPTATKPASALQRAPTVRRRLAAFVYEGVLLFGVLVLVALAYALITNQRHALQGSMGLKVSLLLTLALYFIYFWTKRGQTLAMKTWQMQVVGPNGQPPGPARSALRFALAWLWFLPALLTLAASPVKGAWISSLVLLAGVLAYAASSRLRPDGQFWHDALSGTRLVDLRAT